MNSKKMKLYAMSKDVPLYAVADALGVSTNTLWRWMRCPHAGFPDAFRQTVDQIAAERGGRSDG